MQYKKQGRKLKPPVSPNRSQILKENVVSPKSFKKRFIEPSLDSINPGGRTDHFAYNRQVDTKYRASFYSKYHNFSPKEQHSSVACNRFHSRHIQIRTVRSWNNSPVAKQESPNVKVNQINQIMNAADDNIKLSKTIREGINVLGEYCSSKRILKDLRIKQYREPNFNYLN